MSFFPEIDKASDVNYFLAPLSPTINGVQCYAGIITQPTESLAQRQLVTVKTDCLRFTRFSYMEDSAHPSEGSFTYSSDHEGNHTWVQRPLVLMKGKYTFCLSSKPAAGNRTRISCECTDPEGKKHSVGALDFKGEKAVVYKHFVTFYEIVARKSDNVQKVPEEELPKLILPETEFKLSAFRINGKVVEPKSIDTYYDVSNPQNAQVDFKASNDMTLTILSSKKSIKRGDLPIAESAVGSGRKFYMEGHMKR
ncbi:MAG: hypothetical protein ACSLE1_11295 [Sphingobium sp.]